MQSDEYLICTDTTQISKHPPLKDLQLSALGHIFITQAGHQRGQGPGADIWVTAGGQGHVLCGLSPIWAPHL